MDLKKATTLSLFLAIGGLLSQVKMFLGYGGMTMTTAIYMLCLYGSIILFLYSFLQSLDKE